MTTTRTYKNIRLFIHFFTLIIFLCNLILAVHFLMETRFYQVESALNMGLFDLQVCIKYTIILSTMLAFFASCSVSSKIKWYMKLYLIIGFLVICMLAAFIMFLLGAYKNIFDTQFSIQFGVNASVRYQVKMLLSCGDSGANECTKIADEKVASIKHIFFWCAGISLFLNFLTYMATRVAMFVDISIPSSRYIPRMERSVQMGYDQRSLRNRQLIDSDLRFQGTVFDSSK